MKRKKKAVVLLSGGLDSAVALYAAQRQGYACTCLSFSYGQRHSRELQFARRLAKKAKCPWYKVEISMPWKGSSLLDRSLSIPQQLTQGSAIPSTYVPARNIIFLSFALSCAEAQGASAIFIGAHSQDYSGYPDCRPEFFRAFGNVVSTGTKAGVEKRGIGVQAPLLRMGKAEIIKLGMSLGVPFELTWSCYKGAAKPCGTCDSCRYRAKGFRDAGTNDPLLETTT